MAKKNKVTINYNGDSKTYTTRNRLGFQALCAKEDTPIEYDCRDSDCGICIFRVLEGEQNLSAAEEKERDYLKALHADDNERLACQCRILGDVTVLVEY
ncbi:MAG: (2Fe-2S)-binding protein [Oligoflexales bacterium]|nr:(2Fe-2S)-binding protein [Oligoflexales bacterium]